MSSPNGRSASASAASADLTSVLYAGADGGRAAFSASTRWAAARAAAGGILASNLA